MGELLPFPKHPFQRPIASPIREGLLTTLEHLQAEPQNLGIDLVSEADRFPDERSLARLVGAEINLLPVSAQLPIRKAVAEFMWSEARRCVALAKMAAEIASEIGKDALDALPSALAAVCVVTFIGFICIAMGGA